jgi:hypothetical protein
VSNYIVTGIGANANFVFQTSGTTNRPVIFFNLLPSGQLATTGGLIVGLASATFETQVLRPYTLAVLAASPATHPIEYCSITASNTLKCTASSSLYTWTSFKQIGSAFTLSVGPEVLASPTTVTVNTLEMGVFYGGDCV